MRLTLFFISLFSLFSSFLLAQQDTTKAKIATTSLFADSSSVKLKGNTAKKVTADTIAAKPKHDARKATFRSAVLPGWGQAYNREYWKIPIVYGALAIPTATYFYNSSYYKKMKFAYEALYASTYLGNDSLLSQVSPKVKTKNGDFLSLPAYQSYRNSFKRDKDYSLLWFLLLWGVNVADATVFGHLKDFDVSDDLTMHLNPVYTPSTKVAGLGVVFNFKNTPRKPLPSF